MFKFTFVNGKTMEVTDDDIARSVAMAAIESWSLYDVLYDGFYGYTKCSDNELLGHIDEYLISGKELDLVSMINVGVMSEEEAEEYKELDVLAVEIV